MASDSKISLPEWRSQIVYTVSCGTFHGGTCVSQTTSIPRNEIRRGEGVDQQMELSSSYVEISYFLDGKHFFSVSSADGLDSIAEISKNRETSAESTQHVVVTINMSKT